MSDSKHPRVPAGVEVVPILDLDQFVQLIARRVREAGAFSILLALAVEVLQALRPKGIICRRSIQC